MSAYTANISAQKKGVFNRLATNKNSVLIVAHRGIK